MSVRVRFEMDAICEDGCVTLTKICEMPCLPTVGMSIFPKEPDGYGEEGDLGEFKVEAILWHESQPDVMWVFLASVDDVGNTKEEFTRWMSLVGWASNR